MFQIGCFLCILGSTIIVIHSPKEEEIENIEVLLLKIQEPGRKCLCTYLSIYSKILLENYLLINRLH